MTLLPITILNLLLFLFFLYRTRYPTSRLQQWLQMQYGPRKARVLILIPIGLVLLAHELYWVFYYRDIAALSR